MTVALEKRKRRKRDDGLSPRINFRPGARPGGLLTFVHYFLSPDASNEKDQ